jgi:hypothetical protein
MFLWPVVLIGLILAIVARRPLGTLLAQRFHRTSLLWLGIGAQLLFVPSALHPVLSASIFPGLPKIGGLLYISSLALVLGFALLNRRTVSIAVIGLGLLMNAAVIAANGGQMPVDPIQLAAQGTLDEMVAEEADGGWSVHSTMGDGTRLAFMGDWVMLTVPRPVGKSVILSPGDVVIACGILMFLLVIPLPSVALPETPA